MNKILQYFPNVSVEQKKQFEQLKGLYELWNAQINVISRKDIDFLYERHVLHSLGIAKVIEFKPGTKILDVGTGGGFPGIPLAILFPEAHFHLVDSVGKKIKVVNEVVAGLGLKNVTTQNERAEKITNKFHFITSRAVTEFPLFYEWVRNKFIPKDNFNKLPNGILCLKGGDIKQELGKLKNKCRIYDLSLYFKEEFFETKKVVYLKM